MTRHKVSRPLAEYQRPAPSLELFGPFAARNQTATLRVHAGSKAALPKPVAQHRGEHDHDDRRLRRTLRSEGVRRFTGCRRPLTGGVRWVRYGDDADAEGGV